MNKKKKKKRRKFEKEADELGEEKDKEKTKGDFFSSWKIVKKNVKIWMWGIELNKIKKKRKI